MTLGLQLRRSPSGAPQFNRFFESNPRGVELITTDGVATRAVLIETPPLNSVVAVQAEAVATRRDNRALIAQVQRLAMYTTDETGTLALSGADATVGPFEPGGATGLPLDPITFAATGDDEIEVLVTGDGTPNDVKWEVFVTTDLLASALPA